MADELDDLLRRAMKTLDDQAPAGYFDALPQRTLARLEDGSMQPTGTMGTDRDAASGPTGVPPIADRDDDSGLHDIRSLASSTKARLSSRRSTQNPVMSEDDIIASSSAGWKAVALPEPAKMISLPELADLPSAKEIKAQDKAARKAKAHAGDEKAVKVAAVETPSVANDAAPATSLPPITNIGARIAAKGQSSGKGKTIALVGVGLAAAAGVTIFFTMNRNKDEAAKNSAESTVAAAAPAAEYKSTSKMLPPPPPAAQPAAAPASGEAAGSGAVAQIATSNDGAPEPAKAVATKTADKGKPHKVEVKDTSMTDRAEKEKAPPKEDKKEKAKGGEEGEPSFDALLKEAGVSDQKKQAKPTLDKKSLSGGDIKTGMASIAGKAQGCYSGTQGTASVKLTVAPSGAVQKHQAAGRNGSMRLNGKLIFPPWDGGPQSFGYSYLLSE